MPQLNLGTQYVDVDGMVVEADALRIAESIKAYDPNLEVLCVNPDRASDISEEPFIIAEHCKDGVLRPVFRCWELNDLVLSRIQLADGHRFSALKSVQESEKAFRESNERRYKEWREEAKDVVGHVIKNRKSKYTVRDPRTGEMLIFHDDKPTERL